MAKVFKVLLIDDDKRVIDLVQDYVSRKSKEFDGRIYSIEFHAVQIEVEVNDGSSNVSIETFNKLATACKYKPDLILADFGYVNKEIGEKVKAESQSKKKKGEVMTAAELEGKIFTPKHLANIINNSEDLRLRALQGLLNKNFINSKAKFYLYSYPSEEFYYAYGPVDSRGKITQLAFPKCDVKAIDTKVNFYAEEKFDSFDEVKKSKSKHDADFYAHLVCNFVESVVQYEFLNFILDGSKNTRYDRLKMYAKILGVAAGVGLAAEALGAQIFRLMEHGNWVSVITFGLAGAIAIIVLGIGASFLIEHFIELKQSKHVAEEIDNESD